MKQGIGGFFKCLLAPQGLPGVKMACKSLHFLELHFLLLPIFFFPFFGNSAFCHHQKCKELKA